MSYQPGDEKLARKFQLPHPDMDPRVYEPWLQGFEGEMNRIMMEMQEEMMPLMMPGGMSQEMHGKMMDQFRKKLAPGMDAGEMEGSWHDVMKAMMPDMQMMPEAMQPGATPQKMIDAMLAGWQQKWGNLPDVEPLPMTAEPQMPPLPEEVRRSGWQPINAQDRTPFKP